MANVFPLRLPVSTHLSAHDLAAREGMSLNQFIAMAVAERSFGLMKAKSLIETLRPTMGHIYEGAWDRLFPDGPHCVVGQCACWETISNHTGCHRI